MGYAKSLPTLRQRESALALLAQGQPCEWDRPSGDADSWAYKLREALYIADYWSKRHPLDLQLKALADARTLFAIQVISSTLVRAVFANPTEIGEEPRPAAQALTPSPAYRVSQIRSAEDLQGVWLSRQPTNDKIHFPDAQLTDSEIWLAAAWAASLTPPWMILRPKGTNSLTLAPDDPRVPEEAKIRGPKRAVSADEAPPQLADKTPSGRSWEKAPTVPPPPAVEPPDLDGHGGSE